MAAGLPTYDCPSFVLTIALFSLGESPSDRSYPPARFPPPLPGDPFWGSFWEQRWPGSTANQ